MDNISSYNSFNISIDCMVININNISITFKMIEYPKDIIKPIITSPRSIFIYAPIKLGKTDICLSLTKMTDKALFLDLEDSCSIFEGRYISIKKLLSVWDKLKLLDELLDDIIKNQQYDYIIVDSLTILEEWCESHATVKYMKSTQGKKFNRLEDEKTLLPEKDWNSVLSIGEGYGYQHLRSSFNLYFEKIQKLAKHIILTGHVKDKLLEKKGELVTTTDIDLTGKLKFIVTRKIDAVGLLTADENKRYLTFQVNDNSGGAGSRFNYLNDKILISEKNDDVLTTYWESIFPELK